MGGKKKGNKGEGNSNRTPNQQENSSFKFDFSALANSNAPKGGISKDAQAALLPIIQKKMNKLVGKSSGYFESLPPSVQKKVKALKNLQQTHDKYEEEMRKELAALERKYDAMKIPLYNRRSDIINGSEPTAEELVEEKSTEVKVEEEKKVEKEENVKGIPKFWLEALKHHEAFGDMITAEDEDCLEHLIDIKCTPVSNEKTPSPSFVLEFHFEKNNYFEEEVLKKTYTLAEDSFVNEIMFQTVDATEITWKNGKNLTIKKFNKQQKVGGKGGRKGGGRAQQTRNVVVEEPCASFFNFFSPPSGDIDDIDEEELGELLEEDYELGDILKTQIIPNAVKWYSGEANQFNNDDDDDEK